MKSIHNQYDNLKQKLNNQPEKEVAVQYLDEFEKRLVKSDNSASGKNKKLSKKAKKQPDDLSADFFYSRMETLIRKSNELSPLKLLMNGLELATQFTNNEIGFYHQINLENVPELIIWPHKTNVGTIDKISPVLDSLIQYVKQTGLSLINNKLDTILMISSREKIVLKNVIIVPIFESDTIEALLIVGNRPKDYCEKDVSQLMFLGANIQMMAKKKKTEDAYKLSENNLRILTQHINDYIWSCDLKGQLTFMNSPAIEALGYNQAQLLKLTIFDFFLEKDRALFSYRFKSRINLEKKGIHTESSEYIVEHIRKDGSVFWAEIHVSPLRNEAGKITGLTGITRDVSQRIIDEKNLKDSERRLREAVAAKDKFLSIIAHDLKSPFSALVGLTEVLLEKHLKMDPDKREEIIRSIYQSSLRTYNLLENLLDWSRMQTGRKMFKPEEVHLKKLALDIFDLFAEMIKRKNIEFKIIEEKQSNVFADVDMIGTVLRNLLSNSLKYTPNGGKITLQMEDQHPEHVRVIFSDTGLGIEPADLKKLFRIDGNFSTPGIENEKGTGLGLILCKEFIEKNGGKLEVESQLNRGTTFSFCLRKIPQDTLN